MNVLPEFSSDNFYKFFSISGISLVFASFILFTTQYNITYDKVDRFELDELKLKTEVGFLIEEVAKQDRDDSISKVIIHEFESSSLKSKDKVVIRIVQKIVRDSMNSYLKRKIQIETDRRSKLNQLTLTRKMQDVKSDMICRELKYHKYYTWLCVSMIVLGIIFFSYGSIKWYHLIQRPNDEITKLNLKLHGKEFRKRPSNYKV